MVQIKCKVMLIMGNDMEIKLVNIFVLAQMEVVLEISRITHILVAIVKL